MHGSLPTKLRVLRAERGLTLRDAERLTGVDKDTLSKIERGRRDPQDITLAKIAKGYGVPVEELLEEPVPLVDAPEDGPASLEEGRPEGSSQKDPQRWEKVLESVRERQSVVAAKVEELLEPPDRSEVNPYQVKWALDEAKDCELTLMLSLPGSQKRGQHEITINLLAVDPDQWEEVSNARRFYDSIVKRLVEAGLVRLEESAGQKAEPVPVGIGA